MLKFFCFYEPADTTGTIQYVCAITPEEAGQTVQFNPALAYIEAPALISTADYTVKNGVLTEKGDFDLTFTTLSPSVGQPATLTGVIPVGTKVTLVRDMLSPPGIVETTHVYDGQTAFAFTSNLRAPHRLRFEFANYKTEEVVINVV